MFKINYQKFLDNNPGFQNYSRENFTYHLDIENHSKHYVFDPNLICEILNIKDLSRLSFGASLDYFIASLFNTLSSNRGLSILTTDSESFDFSGYTFSGHAKITKLPVLPFDNFGKRFINESKKMPYDIVFLSHVFFNSGMLIKELEEIVTAIKSTNTLVVIDGTDSFLQLPVDLSLISRNAFYFVKTPSGFFSTIPSLNFLSLFNKLDNIQQITHQVYAALVFLKSNQLTVSKTHALLKRMQYNFRDQLLSLDHHYLCEKNILSVDYENHGSFLTFALPSPKHALLLQAELFANKIITTAHESRLSFGFGLHQDDCIDFSNYKI